ncbi:hypothetical protein EYC82_02195 [Halieaceae bacterium IMCC11814]|uniref:Uncharacterized protein n=1 Tax=Candidatus Marimicrobium litorale TaxID=2518991 RepID=A0ABT3T1N2_9GAMM|nr:hypothetical protein [Candidatus Marimicrobium litorale]
MKLIFCRSAVLPFCRSAVLPFCRSAVLPFCRSAVLRNRSELKSAGTMSVGQMRLIGRAD